jgi:hypothetical protein
VKIGTVTIPEPDGEEYHELAAWYSGFAYAEHYRKVVLSALREMLRAEQVLMNVKPTEARLEDMSRAHPLYLEFLEKHLRGRIRWEHAFLSQGGMR